ncbi:guanylate cyclase 32E [Microplitis demolitor]|uniref:guanylate cyclase 32E n=1 Tax=Microplitis demolitor TaxID=69319 RepID=UPI0006D4E061|nr:guanylate cyclase 32E [Microplitis demolitor]XP_014300036.1 guanylate cyclase 32E [Microplitis demolitor]XP_014300037.1 guanylate cyclase 32E [Microplitis demolitor]XP_014300038.1 guanylate cyclase 32E [Microplitis demolitor]XP_014300039.1 guanylate cyclase 32E [Microplitis demolitor]
MRLVNVERACLLLTTIHVLVNEIVDAKTFTLGYITGSKRRPNEFEYQRPGTRISGAITLAVEEVNAGELGKRGHKLEFLVAETYGEEETSILMTAELWKKNISAYIGPQETCIHEGRMAAAFNLPMISYFCTHQETSNKIEFPTFARTRPPDTQISKSVVSVLLAFNWTKVTFMYMNSSLFEFNNKMSSVAMTILNSFESSGISVNYLRCWKEPYHVTHMNNPFHELVASTYRETRIYVILGNYYEHMGLLMALNDKKLLENGDYWVVGVDTEQYDEKQPDKYLRGLWQKQTDLSLLRAYKSYFSIVASAPVNFDNFTRLIHQYRQKPPFKFSNPLANVGGIVQIVPETAYLYDAVHLYERSLLAALNEGRDPRDGRKMVETLHGVHYHSAMGYMVYMDKNGDAEGNYTLISLDNRSDTGHGLYPIGYFIGKEEITSLPKLRLTREIMWQGNGPPLAEPFCGYHDEKCNAHTGEIIGGIAGGLLLIFISISLILYRNWRYEQELDSLLWKVNYKDIQIRETKDESINCESKSNTKPVVRTSQVSLSSNPDADFRYSMIYTQIGYYKGRMFAIKKVRKKSIEITREMKKELKIMRDLRHDNLNAFIGACTDPPNICIVVEYCARGSLKDILENEDMKLDNMFMASLVGDIIQGMVYLHDSVLKYHGNLSTSNCLVDSRWVVKLADFGLREFKKDAECDPEDVMKKYQGLLYRAPELLRSTVIEEPTVRDYQKADVYSFAIVLYELHGRHGPFGITELTAPEILKRIIVREMSLPPFRPSVDQLENCFDFVRDCLIECWAEDPESRPDFKIIRNKLRPLRKGMKPNIFDNMMAMMEKYANNLEALVDERTDQLTEEKKKTDALLYEMLPRYVAEQLKRGHKVEAEGFDCVTIYFSDIVGFTAMSAESTPLQVVDFLNDLYTCFDSTIENYDVYKVETIGDAYMVVSGLPIRNGIQHAGEIASMSLCLLDAIKQFSIRHRPLEKLQLRIGIHSGPVCAGVVGLKMPRYCLFGDTVNTASRMESTGTALKIHCSQETKKLLDKLGGFNLIERGIISMKGKGERLTYWLIGEDPIQRAERTSDRLERKNGIGGKNKIIHDLLVPKSSLKNKSLTRTTFLRCSSESPKRLRFASSDQLNNKLPINTNELECIVDSSPCKGKGLCSIRSNCMESSRSSSNSCPCVEKLCDSEDQKKNNNISISSNDEQYFKRALYFGNNRILLDSNCRSAPSSPKHSSMILNSQKRSAQSNEEMDGCDATPLIRSATFVE